MDFSEAKEFLTGCVRKEVRDHAFGDAEVFWMKGEDEAATGYFGGGQADVWVLVGDGETTASFAGDEARELRRCGSTGSVYRNDETGPDTFVEGQIMPGLTKETVLEEITTTRKDV